MDTTFNVASSARDAVMSMLSSTTPPSESTTGAVGTTTNIARSDHQHPRLTSSTRVVLDASGLATVTYTRSFATKPAINLTAINPSGRQIVLEVTTDIMTGGVYTGCTVKGSRSQLLPPLTGIVLLTGLLTVIANFDVLGGSASGVEVSVIAIQASN